MSMPKDPDGGHITYELISGHLPPGTHLDNSTGTISGRARDFDATYTFGIRATDQHGKYADGSFSINIRGKVLYLKTKQTHSFDEARYTE